MSVSVLTITKSGDCISPNLTRADILVLVSEEVNKMMAKHRTEVAAYKLEI